MPTTHVRSATNARLAGRAILYALAILLGVLLILPILWGFISSLKPDTEIKLLQPVIFPSHWVPGNYVEVWTSKLFGQWTQNSAFIVLLATTGTVLTAALSG